MKTFNKMNEKVLILQKKFIINAKGTLELHIAEMKEREHENDDEDHEDHEFTQVEVEGKEDIKKAIGEGAWIPIHHRRSLVSSSVTSYQKGNNIPMYVYIYAYTLLLLIRIIVFHHIIITGRPV